MDFHDALHEASHAVIGLLEGVSVQAISVEGDQPRCRVAPPKGWVRFNETGTFAPANPSDRRQLAAHVRWLLAGAIISAQLGELTEDDADMFQATELVASLGLASEDYEAQYLERLQRQTIRRLADNWRAVTAVAERLMSEGVLLGSEARRIIALNRKVVADA